MIVEFLFSKNRTEVSLRNNSPNLLKINISLFKDYKTESNVNIKYSQKMRK